jgi:hypothetical protein
MQIVVVLTATVAAWCHCRSTHNIGRDTFRPSSAFGESPKATPATAAESDEAMPTTDFCACSSKRTDFAFEAENAMAAEKLAQAPWFAQALTNFSGEGRKGWNDDRPLHVRAATGAEATLYRNRCAEFAEEASQLLVVPIDDP